jgi:hypothetical protein
LKAQRHVSVSQVPTSESSVICSKGQIFVYLFQGHKHLEAQYDVTFPWVQQFESLA